MTSWTTRLASAALVAAFATAVAAQDRLKTMAGYEQYVRLTMQIPSAVASGAISPTWSSDSKSFDYTRDGKRFRYDVASHGAEEIPADEAGSGPSTRSGQGGRSAVRSGPRPERGRQFDSATSPDGAWKASYRDRNLWLSRADGGGETAITTDGSEEKRI